MSRRDYAGGAAQTTLTAGFADVTSNPLVINCDDLTNWPNGAADGSLPFFIVIGRGTAYEEKILVTERVGNTLVVNTSLGGQRGADNTAAQTHGVGETVEHVITATDADEANAHVNATSGVHGLGGSEDVVGTTKTQTLTNKTISGTQNTLSNIPQTAVTGLEDDLTTLANAIDDLDTDTYSKSETVSQINSRVGPVGEIAMWPTATAPTGWLLCNGAAVSRTTYAALFAVIGTTFGAGNGSTTFNVPNFTGKMPRGGTPGSTGGSDTVTLSAAQMPAHTHTINHDHGAFNTAETGHHQHGVKAEAYALTLGSTGIVRPNYDTGGWDTTIGYDGTNADAGAHVHSINVPSYSGNSGSAGSGSAVTVTSPYLGINFIIKASLTS